MDVHNNLIELFLDVCRGYSIFSHDNIFFYVKHSNLKLEAQLNSIRKNAYDNSIKSGLLTTEQKIEKLKLDGLWTDLDEKKIKDKKFFLDSLSKSKAKQILPSQKKLIQNQIEIEEKELNKLLIEKNNLIGVTADIISENVRSKYFLVKSIYKDESCNNLYFDEEYLDEDIYEDIYYRFINTINKFNHRNLKLISLTDEFNILFSSCGDNLLSFFGKPAFELTFLQAQILYYGKYFKKLAETISSDTIPYDVRNDPEKLIEWYENKKSGQDILNSNNDKDSALVGATKEDIKMLGLDKSAPKVDFTQEALKKGGSLSMEDILNLQEQ